MSVNGICLVDSMFGRVLAFENDLITQQIVETGAHTRPELAFLLNVVDAGDSILDVGAHIGTFTVPLARKSGGRVVAIEGDPRNFALLEANIKLCGFEDRAQAINAFVGAPDTEYSLERNPKNTGASRFLAAKDGARGERGRTLDDLVDSDIAPDVIKLTLQGMEFDALIGAERLLRSAPILYVMVAVPHLRDCQRAPSDIDRFLRSRGYRFFVNVASRNAPEDVYRERELDALPLDWLLYNVLAIPEGHPRLSKLRL